MRKLLLAGALALVTMLTSCGTLNLNTVSSRNTLYGVTNAYGVALSGAITYKALPLCKTGAPPSLTNICAKRSVIVRLQAADRTAITAINQAAAFIKNNPTLDTTNAIAVAQSAIAAYQAIVTANTPGAQ